MVEENFEMDFEFGLPVSMLKNTVQAIFGDMNVFSNWNIKNEQFEALLTTEQEFDSLDLSYEKLFVYMFGKNEDSNLTKLKVEIRLHNPVGSGDSSKQIQKIKQLFKDKIRKLEEETKPQIKFLHPKDKDLLSGTQKIRARIDRMQVKSVKFLVENEEIYVDSSHKVSFKWDTTQHADGIKELKLVAEDRKGRTVRYNTQVEISNTPPKVVVKKLKSGDIVTGTKVIGLKSRGGQISEINIRIDGENLYSSEIESPRKRIKKAYSWDTTVSKDGWHKVSFQIKTRNEKEVTEIKQILVLNSHRKRPKRRVFRKEKFYKEVLEAVKTLISPHYGGILSLNGATRIMNQLYDFESQLTIQEMKQAVKSSGEDVKWISSNLIEFTPDRKVADSWLRGEIVKFARKRGRNGFNRDEVISHLDSIQDDRNNPYKTRYIEERCIRSLKGLKNSGKLVYQEYPPKWYFSGNTDTE